MNCSGDTGGSHFVSESLDPTPFSSDPTENPLLVVPGLHVPYTNCLPPDSLDIVDIVCSQGHNQGNLHRGFLQLLLL